MITHRRLLELVNYNPKTGIVTWLLDIRGHKRRGKRAGSEHKMKNSHFRRRLCLDGVEYQEHRVIWFYMTGAWPVAQIDHIDRNACNNKWSNLRLDPDLKNNRNRKMLRNNTSGFRGVTKRKGGYSASITIGRYKTPKKAHDAYVAASLLLHGEFSPYYMEQK